MNRFVLNGYLWRVETVDPYNDVLIDRTGKRTVATTDPEAGCIYLSSDLEGDFKTTVLIHELGHCALFSFNLLNDIHRMVHPAFWIEAEEWVCNFIADYGRYIFSITKSILGDDAIHVIPSEIEKFIA